jgi:SNF2 family DNA or RNA helicase
LVERLHRRGISAESYMSGDSETVPERFQEGEFDVLVMTRDTGGEGIDLYRADTAIFIEQHWTPARNQQALSRLHRYGQDKPVSIINLVGIDTIDDGKVLPTNRRKQEIVDAIL